jgi:translation initiation factor 2B subunit (eIF-2B alpha/beta/delta family)
MAKELLKNKIKVEIIPEALLPNAVEKADVAISGADIILSNGNIVNKTGSRSLAILCKYFKKPFYVLATSDKFSKKKKYVPEKRDSGEIWKYGHKYLTKTNFYFEVVEKKLITKVITDKNSKVKSNINLF